MFGPTCLIVYQWIPSPRPRDLLVLRSPYQHFLHSECMLSSPNRTLLLGLSWEIRMWHNLQVPFSRTNWETKICLNMNICVVLFLLNHDLLIFQTIFISVDQFHQVNAGVCLIETVWWMFQHTVHVGQPLKSPICLAILWPLQILWRVYSILGAAVS